MSSWSILFERWSSPFCLSHLYVCTSKPTFDPDPNHRCLGASKAEEVLDFFVEIVREGFIVERLQNVAGQCPGIGSLANLTVPGGCRFFPLWTDASNEEIRADVCCAEFAACCSCKTQCFCIKREANSLNF